MGFIYKVTYQYETAPGVFVSETKFLEIPRDEQVGLVEGPFFIRQGQIIQVPIPTDAILYQVKKGDNIYTIAKKYGVTEQDILKANNFTSSTLQVGQQIIIPNQGGGVTPPEPPTDNYFIYTVVAGDSLWTIAQKFGTTVDEIKKLNNLTSDSIYIGQQLKIPGDGGNVTPPIPPTDNYFIYTVVSGDSLWTIAQRFGTTVNEIKRLNNLTSDSLYIGQQLKIPNSSDNIIYIVQPGDSLWTIANKFGVTVDQIKKANNLTSDVLQVGQKLIIPAKVATTTHVVRAGDSLWTIANKYGTTVDVIKRANNLQSDALQIGQVLTIPLGAAGFSHLVQNGETLWSIAKKYGTTIAILKQLNQLTSDNVFPNQVLILPQIRESISYPVQGGDTLWSIAKQFDTSVDYLKQINQITTNDVRTTTILVPQKNSVGSTQVRQDKKYVEYIIQPNDTVVTIAKQFSTTPEAIILKNALIPYALLFGDIRVELIDGKLAYRVESGDTIYTIAKFANVPVQKIIDANPSLEDPNNLKVGQIIIIPISPVQI